MENAMILNLKMRTWLNELDYQPSEAEVKLASNNLVNFVQTLMKMRKEQENENV